MVWRRFYVLCSPSFAISAQAKNSSLEAWFARCGSSVQPGAIDG
jgi:hypothetical protein